MMVVFREAKVRKAQFGFFAKINKDTIFFLSEPCAFIKQIDPNAVVEVPNNAGVCEVKLYTDHSVAAALFRCPNSSTTTSYVCGRGCKANLTVIDTVASPSDLSDNNSVETKH